MAQENPDNEYSSNNSEQKNVKSNPNNEKYLGQIDTSLSDNYQGDSSTNLESIDIDDDYDSNCINTKIDQETSDDIMKAMPITSHLIELRSRLIKVFSVFILLFFMLMGYSQELYDLISDPLVAELPENASMIAINPTGSFMASIKVTLYVTLLLTIPFILFQIWAFIAPGLYKHEKRLAIPLVLSSILLFYFGIVFAYSLLTNILGFLINFASSNVVATPDVESYLSFVMQIFLAFGATFEIPIITLLLVISGIVSIESLEDKRRYIIVGCFGISAVITPPDGWTMIMLAIPMWLLFEIGLIMSKLFIKNKKETLPILTRD